MHMIVKEIRNFYGRSQIKYLVKTLKLCVCNLPESLVKKESLFPGNEASTKYFVHLKKQIKCYLDHRLIQCSCSADG